MTRRPALVAVAMLLLAFCVGGLTGMALDEAFGLDWFDFLEEDDDSLEDDFFAGLDLSEAQEERIEEILDEQEDRLEAYWETRVPDLRSIVAGSYAEIRTILEPAQREVFDQRVQARGLPVPREPD